MVCKAIEVPCILKALVTHVLCFQWTTPSWLPPWLSFSNDSAISRPFLGCLLWVCQLRRSLYSLRLLSYVACLSGGHSMTHLVPMTPEVGREC